MQLYYSDTRFVEQKGRISDNVYISPEVTNVNYLMLHMET